MVKKTSRKASDSNIPTTLGGNMPLRVGVHEKWTAPDNGRTPAQVATRFPGATIGRAFVADVLTGEIDLRPKVDSVLAPYLTAKVPVIYVSVKTDLARTRAGHWNTRFQELGAHLKNTMTANPGIEIKFIWWHEPEDDMMGDAFAHAFNKVRTHVRTGGPDVKVVYSAMAWQWKPGGAGPFNSTADPAHWKTVTADEYVVDVYSGRSYDLPVILPEHPGFARWLSVLVPAGAPYGVTERGFETPSEPYPTNRSALRVTTIQREFDWLKDTADGQRCQNYNYWNSSGTEEASGLRLDAAGEAALATEIAELTAPPPPPPQECDCEAEYARGLTDGEILGYDRGLAAGKASGVTIGRQAYRNEVMGIFPPA